MVTRTRGEVLYGSRDPRRLVLLEGDFIGRDAALFDAIDRIVPIESIHSGFTFGLEAGGIVTVHDGITHEYEHDIVDLEDPVCPACGAVLDVIEIEPWYRPIWGLAACERCKNYFPAVVEDP